MVSYFHSFYSSRSHIPHTPKGLHVLIFRVKQGKERHPCPSGPHMAPCHTHRANGCKIFDKGEAPNGGRVKGTIVLRDLRCAGDHAERLREGGRAAKQGRMKERERKREREREKEKERDIERYLVLVLLRDSHIFLHFLFFPKRTVFIFLEKELFYMNLHLPFHSVRVFIIVLNFFFVSPSSLLPSIPPVLPSIPPCTSPIQMTKAELESLEEFP